MLGLGRYIFEFWIKKEKHEEDGVFLKFLEDSF